MCWLLRLVTRDFIITIHVSAEATSYAIISLRQIYGDMTGIFVAVEMPLLLEWF